MSEMKHQTESGHCAVLDMLRRHREILIGFGVEDELIAIVDKAIRRRELLTNKTQTAPAPAPDAAVVLEQWANTVVQHLGATFCQDCEKTGCGEHSPGCPRGAALAVLQRLREAEAGWRPIETAPKDGTPILVCVTDCRQFTVVSWQRMNHEDDFGWGDAAGFPDCTHWRPLPAPPVKEAPNGR
jgi:hypothetical protein